MNLEFDDVHELKSLHRLLYENKFTMNPTIGASSFSPHIANLQRKIFELIVEADEKESEWREWQKLDTGKSHLITLFKTLISEQEWWAVSNEELRTKYVESFFSPHLVSIDLMSELLNCT